MDAIEEVLSSVRLQSSVFCRMVLAGEWGFAKDALRGAPFHLILSGEAWLRINADDEPLHLRAGDVVVLPGGEAHHLMGSPSAELVPFQTLMDKLGMLPWHPGMRFKTLDLQYGVPNGSCTTLISGIFDFGNRQRNPLLSALPPILHLTRQPGNATGDLYAATVSLLDAEVMSGRPGSGTVAERLADILFVQAVRSSLSSAGTPASGWLRGLADPQIGRAIALIHAQADRDWSVASLAEAAGTSRSRFAARFQTLVGRGPLEYLTNWRMYRAAGRLAEEKVGLAELAATAGYRSEVAFSKAFKRWSGHSPAEFRRLSVQPVKAASMANL